MSSIVNKVPNLDKRLSSIEDSHKQLISILNKFSPQITQTHNTSTSAIRKLINNKFTAKYPTK